MNKEEQDLFDYACVMARFYALILPKDENNPFRKELDEEKEQLFGWIGNHACLETEVIKHVRKLIPESNWDESLVEVCEEAWEALENNDLAAMVEITNKLLMYHNKDWRERENLEKLL
jgi:hypothetical protein